LRLLFHACCGPCFVRVGPVLRDEGHDVTAFFYNPNVQPYKEFEARRGALREVCEVEGLDVIEYPHYDPEAWLRTALDAESRCEACYRDRLVRAARRAKAAPERGAHDGDEHGSDHDGHDSDGPKDSGEGHGHDGDEDHGDV